MVFISPGAPLCVEGDPGLRLRLAHRLPELQLPPIPRLRRQHELPADRWPVQLQRECGRPALRHLHPGTLELPALRHPRHTVGDLRPEDQPVSVQRRMLGGELSDCCADQHYNLNTHNPKGCTSTNIELWPQSTPEFIILVC